MSQIALSGADLALTRAYQWIDSAQLFVTPLVSVVTGTISAVPTKYPTTSLTVTWDGSAAGVVIGQYFRITSGATLISHGIIRKAVSGTTCYINETPLGSYGFATNIESAILAGMVITIYTHHAPFSLNSRIAAKIFLKYWDLGYTNQNEVEWPVANAGAWQCAKLASGESTARFTLPRGGDNISFALATPDGIIDSNVLWELPAGVSLVSGYADDDMVIEVDAVAGAHLVKFTVYYVGEEHTAYVWLFVSDGSTGVSLDESISITIESDTQNLLGREMTFIAVGTNLQNNLYDGAGVLFKEYPKYTGSSLSAGASVDTFIGYITELDMEHNGNYGVARFKVVSPMILAQQIGQPSQSLTQVANATTWNQMTVSYANVRAFAHYLIKWTAPFLLNMHDLDIPYDYENWTRKYLEVNNKSLQGNLQTVADYILANIGSASDGSTVMRRKPQYLSNTDRNLIPTILTFLETDIRAPLRYQRRIYNPISDVRGGAFIYSGTNKPKAAYGGRRWSQGSGTADLQGFIVTTSEGETRVKEVVGHYMAEQNAAIQAIGLDLLRNQDVIDPVYLCWVGLTVSSDFDPYASGFSATRLFVTEISREWALENGTKTISLTAQIETFGQAGEILPIGNAKGFSQGGYSIGTPTFWTPDTSTGMFGGAQSASLVLALNTNGALALSSNYLANSPSWSGMNTVEDGIAISDFDFDYGSAFFANGRNAADALGLYAVTVDGTTAQIWYYPDILRSNNANEVASLTLSDSTIATQARIKCSETYPDLVIAVFKDGTGTRFSRSTNGGSVWSSLTRVGSSITDSADNDNAPIGLAVYGQYQFLTAPDATPAYGTYRATTANGAFSKMTGSQDSPFPISMIAEAVETNDYLYASQIDVASYSNDNDGSDYFTYSAPPFGGGVAPYYSYTTSAFETWTRIGVVAGGNPGNCEEYQCASMISNNSLNGFQLPIDFSNLGAVIVLDYSFDVKWVTTTNTKRLLLSTLDGDSAYLTGQNTWHHFQGSKDSANHEGNATVFAPTFHIDGGDTGTAYIYIDNVTLYLGVGRKLWRVSNATGSPSWTNITPATNKAPYEPFSLVTNLLDNSDLQMVAFDGKTWYSSTNNGSSWTTEDAASDFRTFYQWGTNLLEGGLDTIQISFNTGSTDSSIEGDLDNLWNGLGTIKKMLAL